MRTHKIRWIALLLCALLFAGCGAGPSQTSGPPTTPTFTPVPRTPTPAVSPAGTVSAMIPGMGTISQQYDSYGIAADSTAVWVYNGETGNLLRIDPKTNRLVATIPVGPGCAPHNNCGGVALGQGAVWVAAGASSKVVRVDPRTNRVVATIPFPDNEALNVFVTPGVVWVTDYYDNVIFQIDPQTNKMMNVLTPAAGPTGVAFAGGSLWRCEAHNTPDGLIRLDPATMQMQAQVDVSANQGFVYCVGLVALDQAVWVVATNSETSILERIDPTTNKVTATAPVPGTQGSGFAADAQGAWLLDSQSGLSRFDPHSGQLVGGLAISGGLGLALGAGSVWVAKGDGTVVRITPAS